MPQLQNRAMSPTFQSYHVGWRYWVEGCSQEVVGGRWFPWSPLRPLVLPHFLMKESSEAPSSLAHIWPSNPADLPCPPPCFHIRGASSLQGLGLQMHMPHASPSFPGLSSCSLCSYFLPLSFLRRPGATSVWLSLFISSALFSGSSVSCCSTSGVLWGSSLLPHQGQVCFFFLIFILHWSIVV